MKYENQTPLLTSFFCTITLLIQVIRAFSGLDQNIFVGPAGMELPLKQEPMKIGSKIAGYDILEQ